MINVPYQSSKQNIINSILRDYKKKYGNNNVSYQKLSKVYINNIIKQNVEYPFVECVEMFYDDSLTFNNWIDVEGMGYGWIWSDCPRCQWRNKICSLIRNYYFKQKTFKNTKKMIVIKTPEKIIFHIPSRFYNFKKGKFNSDVVITFSKKELFFF